MRYVLVAVGTLGDVVPFVAVGKAIRAHGHDVAIATHTDFAAMVRGHGLEFVEMGGSFQALMESDAGRDWLESAGNPLRYQAAARRLLTPIIDQWIADAERALADAEVALVHCAAGGAQHAAEARRIPHIVVSPYPWVPSRLRPSIFMPRAKVLPLGAMNAWLSWRLLQFVWSPYFPQIQAQRARLGLARQTVRGFVRHVTDLRLTDLHLYSGALAPPPADWGAHVEVTGFAFLDGAIATPPPAGLEEFLAAGAPPVYVGFGSMTGRDPGALAAIVRDASRNTKHRLVVATGWGGLAAGASDERLFVVRAVNHDTLFPRCAAVVHHGGAGTTAATLRAGRPAVVVPFFGDQPLWAAAVVRAGAGLELDKKRLDGATLGAAIDGVVAAPEKRARAEQVGAALRAENGALRAAERAIALAAPASAGAPG